MKDFLFYSACIVLALLLGSQILLIVSRKTLTWAKKRKEESLRELNAARKTAAAAKAEKYQALLEHEIIRGTTGRRSDARNLN